MKRALPVTREDNFPEWYQAVVDQADLAETSPVRGCMIIKPWGWGIWELVQASLDKRIKETGHENCYFPLFIPISFIAQEASHVEGFAKEMAVVTHHRLKAVDGKLVVDPASELEEPLVVRPTSETIIGDAFRRWVAVLSRPADPHQSMGQRRALGNAHPDVPAHHRIPLAGGPYRPRHQGRRTRRNAEDARSLSRAGRGRAGHAGGGRREAGERAFPGRGFDLLDRGDDAGRQGPAGRHLALSREPISRGRRTSATSRRPASWNSATRRRGAYPRGSSAASS